MGSNNTQQVPYVIGGLLLGLVALVAWGGGKRAESETEPKPLLPPGGGAVNPPDPTRPTTVEKVPVGGKLYVNLSSTPLLSSYSTTFASTVDTATRGESLTVVETPRLLSKWIKVKRDKSGKIGYVSMFNVTAARSTSQAGLSTLIALSGY